ncbi:1-phosphofructokinase [Paenibacillus koleovorans]|uniref:1-phosphofructokinase n=1 Tax=Paenibacillus koleovorans TaxID=121608 RepID=UPI000FDCD052|nr:1-phosphofructokinase [Paenibacillus koleovorans]
MITTVTLNAAIDKTYFVDGFELGRVSRASRMISYPGGKGVNVARVAYLLGGPVRATGFVGGSNGSYIERQLEQQGIANDFVRVEGESRLCLNIIDPVNGRSTELLEQGPEIEEAQAAAMKHKIRELAAQSKIVTLSGSLPKGLPASFYAELIAIVRAEGAMAFLDASGDALVQGIQAKPFLIKPNEDEVEKILGKKLERVEDVYSSVYQLMRDGIRCVVVSLGAEGSVAGYDGIVYRIHAPRIEAVNTVGCGDSFVAGMAVALERGDSIQQALKLATATGTANALMPEAGNVRLEDVSLFLEQVRIETIA